MFCKSIYGSFVRELTTRYCVAWNEQKSLGFLQKSEGDIQGGNYARYILQYQLFELSADQPRKNVNKTSLKKPSRPSETTSLSPTPWVIHGYFIWHCVIIVLMAENIKAKTKKQKKIRVVPIKEARYVKAVLLLPKEVVSELLKSIYRSLTWIWR